MKAKRFIPAAALSAAIIIGGCGNSSDKADPSPKGDSAEVPTVPAGDWVDDTGQAEVTVDAKDNSFDPKYVEVSPGTEVTFDNRGRNPHNVIAVEEDQFETVPVENLQPGDKAVRTFDEPGEYAYYCSLHGTPTAGMIGRIKVVDG